MKYVQYINSLLQDSLSKKSNTVVYGQNIDAGSCISGLTRNLSLKNHTHVINTQNSENTLVGVGFGMMINEVSSIFFMKQTDFLLLGIDHLVNTYNIIRQTKPTASFTIFPVTVDSGYEGPQSSLNNLGDFCSIAGVDGYTFTNKNDAKDIITNHLIKPGFRVMSTGQKYLREEILDLEILNKSHSDDYFQYKKGSKATIVCFNLALIYGIKLHEDMLKRKITSSLFSVNAHLCSDYSSIINDIKETQKLIIIDDTKSRNRLSDKFLTDVLSECRLNKKIVVSRSFNEQSFYPNNDELEIDNNKLIESVTN